jgi:hypothetical protein
MAAMARGLGTMEVNLINHWLMLALLAITISELLKRFAK